MDIWELWKTIDSAVNNIWVKSVVRHRSKINKLFSTMALSARGLIFGFRFKHMFRRVIPDTYTNQYLNNSYLSDNNYFFKVNYTRSGIPPWTWIAESDRAWTVFPLHTQVCEENNPSSLRHWTSHRPKVRVR